MRSFFPLTSLALLAACSAQEQADRSAPTADLKTFNSTELMEAPPMDAQMPSRSSADRTAGPGINVTAAPGVAFNYQYGFSLPAERVATVQEQHAQLCEKIGIAQCRITGMLYRRVNEEDIEAMLAFKLDPAIARQFGKDGIAIVDGAEGMLVEAQITGEDAGAAIASATRSEAQFQDELRRVEAQLGRSGLTAAERAELQIQAQHLRDSIRSTRADKSRRQDSLARTPVIFRYGAGDYAPGFEDGAPIATALERSGDNLVAGFAAMLVILITLLPWLLLALLGWLGWRRIRKLRDERAVKTELAAAQD